MEVTLILLQVIILDIKLHIWLTMKLLEKNIRPRDIVTKKSLENAAVVVAASGGSTNAALHLPAIANEAGINFTLEDVTKISKKTPYIADLKPGGKYVAKDMWEAGGVPMLLKTLYDGGFIHGECMTVTGKTMKENLKDIKFNSNQKLFAIFSKTPFRVEDFLCYRLRHMKLQQRKYLHVNLQNLYVSKEIDLDFHLVMVIRFDLSFHHHD